MTLMSETPRSDSELGFAPAYVDEYGEKHSSTYWVSIEFARQLERELAAALERVKELEGEKEELVSTKKFLLSELNALNKKIRD